MADNEYPVGTIWEMAAIPAEARVRFLAEFPELLESAARLIEVQGTFADLDIGAELIAETPVWVDDDKQTKTFTAEFEGEQLFSVTVPLENSK